MPIGAIGSMLLNAGIQTASNLLSGATEKSMNDNSALLAFNRERDENRFLIQHGPEMQVKALEDAGLNPALLNGQVSNLSSPSSPSGSTHIAPAVLDAQLGLLSSQQKSNQANAYEAITKGLDNSASAYRNRIEAIKSLNLSPYERNLLIAQEEEAYTRANANNAAALSSIENANDLAATRPSRIRQADESANASEAQAKSINEQLPIMIDNLKQDLTNKVKEGQLTDASAAAQRKLAEQYEQQSKLLIKQQGIADEDKKRIINEAYKALREGTESAARQRLDTIQAEMEKKYGGWKRVQEIISGYFTSIGTAIGLALGGAGLAKKAASK